MASTTLFLPSFSTPIAPRCSGTAASIISNTVPTLPAARPFLSMTRSSFRCGRVPAAGLCFPTASASATCARSWTPHICISSPQAAAKLSTPTCLSTSRSNLENDFQEQPQRLVMASFFRFLDALRIFPANPVALHADGILQRAFAESFECLFRHGTQLLLFWADGIAREGSPTIRGFLLLRDALCSAFSGA